MKVFLVLGLLVLSSFSLRAQGVFFATEKLLRYPEPGSLREGPKGAESLPQAFTTGDDRSSLPVISAASDLGWDTAGIPGPHQLSLLHAATRGTVFKPDVPQRRLQLFLHEFGASLARMDSYLPTAGGLSASAEALPRAFLRTDGRAGFLFVNGGSSATGELQYSLQLNRLDDPLQIPSLPVSLSAPLRSIWPLNLPLSEKITLGYASAFPLCMIDVAGDRTLFLAATTGMPTEIGIVADLGVQVRSSSVKPREVRGGNLIFPGLQPGHSPVLELKAPGSPLVRIVLLSEADSLKLMKLKWLGEPRVLLWGGKASQDGDRLDLYDEVGRNARGRLLVYPNPTELVVGTRTITGKPDGLFTAYDIGGTK